MRNVRLEKRVLHEPARRRWSVLAGCIPAVLLLALSTHGVLAETAGNDADSRSLRALTSAESAALQASEYVYIASTRKSGDLGTPAEIWFWEYEDAIWVGTRPGSWRARRIGWGRPEARIWIGKRDGPSLRATGSIVRDQPDVWQKFCDALAKKYPESWPRHEAGFKTGYADGSRVLIRYDPVSR
jgi:hypothetical protein